MGDIKLKAYIQQDSITTNSCMNISQIYSISYSL